VKQLPPSPDAHDLGATGHALHLRRGVKYVDGQSVAGRDLAIIGYSLVDDTHQVRFVRVLHLQGEYPSGISFRAALLRHPLVEAKKNYIVACRWPACAPVADRTGNRSGQRRRTKRSHQSAEDQSFPYVKFLDAEMRVAK
jgi:hypothetical protein